MKIEHHPGDDLLLAYSAGTLDEATSLLVATHLALCPVCRSDLDLLDTIGGALIEQAHVTETADASIPDTILNAASDARHANPAETMDSPPKQTGAYVLPQPLRNQVGADAAGLAWRTIGGGIRQFPVSIEGGGSTARLLYIPAGKGVPDHGHHGLEMTLVLAGSFYDRGSYYRRGDVGIADPGVVHHPTAGPEEDCICLAVTDAPLKFQSLIPRLLQRFHGI